jgi:hypothetical protein
VLRSDGCLSPLASEPALAGMKQSLDPASGVDWNGAIAWHGGL